MRSWFLALWFPLVCQSPLDWPPKPTVPPLPSEQTLVDPDWLARELAAGAAVAVDVRAGERFADGHLPGALRGSELCGSEAETTHRLAEQGVAPGLTLSLYGQDRHLEAVAACYWRLRQAGLRARVLAGGIEAWRGAGRALETGAARLRPAVPAAAVEPDPVAYDVEQVAALLGSADVALLDVRDARGWEQWETPPTFGAGHIPHALPFDLDALLGPDGTPAALEQIRERVLRHGPRPESPVPPGSTYIVYGNGADDPRAAVTFLLLEAAGFEARLFPGGFAAWTAASQPVVRVVEPAEVRELLAPQGGSGTANLLDLRDESAFASGHLPGAVNVPCYDFDAEVTAALAALDPGPPLVLYCYGPGCIRSWNALPLAARRGMRSILWFRGGAEAWKQAGYPEETSPRPP